MKPCEKRSRTTKSEIIEGFTSAKSFLNRQARAESYPVSAGLKQRIKELFGFEEPEAAVKKIIEDVHDSGDAALLDYTQKIDGIKLGSLEVTRQQIAGAYEETNPALVSALRLLVRLVNESAGIHTFLDAGDGVDRLPTEIEICLYRVAQEALTNAVKHSGAGFISLYLVVEDGHVRLDIADDGAGFDSKKRTRVSDGRSGERLGLFGMRERVRSLDGSLSIDSEPGGGTRISAVLPLDAHK